jgi:hypothetical protein
VRLKIGFLLIYTPQSQLVAPSTPCAYNKKQHHTENRTIPGLWRAARGCNRSRPFTLPLSHSFSARHRHVRVHGCPQDPGPWPCGSHCAQEAPCARDRPAWWYRTPTQQYLGHTHTGERKRRSHINTPPYTPPAPFYTLTDWPHEEVHTGVHCQRETESHMRPCLAPLLHPHAHSNTRTKTHTNRNTPALSRETERRADGADILSQEAEP